MTLPSAATRTRFAAGSRGSAGMVTMSPMSATMKPAPAEALSSWTVSVKPFARPLPFGSLLNDRCVLAMQTGRPA